MSGDTMLSNKPIPYRNAIAIKDTDPAERFSITLLLRPGQSINEMQVAAARIAAQKPSQRDHLSRSEFAKQYGAARKDIAAIERFASRAGLETVSVHRGRRTITLSGTSTTFNAAFNVKLKDFAYSGGIYRGHIDPLKIPSALMGMVIGVFGLDNRPWARPHFRIRRSKHGKNQGGYTPPMVATLYKYPNKLQGTGQTIALIELGGGFKSQDLKTYFASLGLDVPQINVVSVDGAHNVPVGDPDSADGEVVLDIEIAGSVAPKAKLVVYFAPNTNRGFLDAINTALHDDIRKPSVISISWGGPEVTWGKSTIEAFNQVLMASNLLGVTILVAAGDNGSTDGEQNGRQNVDFPGSSPYVLACGGTSLVAGGKKIAKEVVWNDQPNGATGGGISDYIPRPDWQQTANVPVSVNAGIIGRGVPDLASDADPNTGFKIRVDGVDAVFGGTSAAAPLVAGLIARLNEGTGRNLGFLNQWIYEHGTGGFRDVKKGTNGAYSATTGWDACTGWGSPEGSKLLALLKSNSP